ncbi:LytTR family DNA-binding domain-containing protein [Pedobacter sp. Hv1]|uniref:LytR/AlgR family response regulator transcription factor n=1 Tax=Pedobacter sp. Hv1 TaxID=1740090 RepID=UPI0006D8B3A5|nr:response regulator transcription factor [Pedobacter sp. Hv1]KQC02486.1 two-component system response regulator [Pedobacter sp. Hv1]
MKIKTLIVDDEPHALEVIENYLQHFSDIELVAKCPDGIKAFQILQQKSIDLVFLDIKMPGLNGTDLIKSLKSPPKVIFTTAYSEYAVDGFELNAIDYLLKPIPFDRFLKSMDKVLAHFGNNKQIVLSEKQSLANTEKFLYLKVDRKMMKINVNEICWIESIKDYVKVVLSDRVLISKQKIGLLEELLPEEQFCRIHRSFIISIAKVESYYAYAVEILGRELPIGRNYKQNVQKSFRDTQY